MTTKQMTKKKGNGKQKRYPNEGATKKLLALEPGRSTIITITAGLEQSRKNYLTIARRNGVSITTKTSEKGGVKKLRITRLPASRA